MALLLRATIMVAAGAAAGCRHPAPTTTASPTSPGLALVWGRPTQAWWARIDLPGPGSVAIVGYGADGRLERLHPAPHQPNGLLATGRTAFPIWALGCSQVSAPSAALSPVLLIAPATGLYDAPAVGYVTNNLTDPHNLNSQLYDFRHGAKIYSSPWLSGACRDRASVDEVPPIYLLVGSEKMTAGGVDALLNSLPLGLEADAALAQLSASIGGTWRQASVVR